MSFVFAKTLVVPEYELPSLTFLIWWTVPSNCFNMRAYTIKAKSSAAAAPVWLHDMVHNASRHSGMHVCNAVRDGQIDTWTVAIVSNKAVTHLPARSSNLLSNLVE